MLPCEVLQRAIAVNDDIIPSLTGIRHLEGTGHAVDDFIRNLAGAIELASLAFANGGNNQFADALHTRHLSLDGGNQSLSCARMEVGCIIDYITAILESLQSAALHLFKDYFGVALVIGVTPQLLSNCVGRYPNCIGVMLVSHGALSTSWLRKSN
jgi:hypothetical protein